MVQLFVRTPLRLVTPDPNRDTRLLIKCYICSYYDYLEV